MLQRWGEHVYNSKSKTGKGCHHLWNAIRKYGKDAFSHRVILQVNDVDLANAWEEFWIDFLDTRNPEHGFNVARGGSHTPHPVKNPWDRPGFREKHPSTIHNCHTPEARARQKAALTPEKRSEATRKAFERADVREYRAALNADPEHLRRISEATKAALARPDVRARTSAAIRELWQDSGYREKVISAVRTAHLDPEVKDRHRAAVTEAQNRPETLAKHRAYRASDETKARIAASSTGRLHTEESLEAQRRLYLERSSSCRFCSSLIEGKRSAVNGRVACLPCHALHRAGHVTFLRPDRSFV